MSRISRSICWLSAAAALVGPQLAGSQRASAAEQDPFVESGGTALRERLQIPWYDAETDKLQPIELTEPWDLEFDFSWLADPLYWLAIAVAVGLVLLLVWLVGRFVIERERGRATARPARADPLVVADRIEALPFMRERSLDDLLGQARRHYEQGNYSEAIIYLFSYQLVELDRSSLVRLARGKTNRQYLREAGRVRPLAGLLELTMVTFEDVFFGSRALDRAGFEDCWTRLDQFDALVAQAQAGT
ncbi:MAG: DUF4129 domain-containing protein [Pirellulales bacterium]